MIYQFSPFYKENLILHIAASESSLYGGKIYITEADKTFKGKKKPLYFNNFGDENISYNVLKANHKFFPNNILGKILLSPYRLSKNTYKKGVLKSPAWYNEGYQRNYACSVAKIKDDDIVILCDVDEILDSRVVDRVIEKVKKYGIVTGKLHFTLYYFNLFSINWGGPKDYSYRMFIMTGKYFNNLSITSDELRKKGEAGELYNKVYLMDEFIGFHHSWLGDTKFVSEKMAAYAHDKEHDNRRDTAFIESCINNNLSIFPNHKLEKNENIKLLLSVDKYRDDERYSKFFLK